MRVEMAFPAPARTYEHERLFECPVRFDAPRSAFALTRAALADRQHARRPRPAWRAGRPRRTLGQKVPTGPAPVREVRRAIIDQLASGPPSLEGVARKLAMSPRTLQRRLRDHELSYADLLDSTRAAAAKSYLTDQQISVAELAYLLGFSEQSSFNHAFKRWTGQAPSEYRKHA